jgi:hypothetical protein
VLLDQSACHLVCQQLSLSVSDPSLLQTIATVVARLLGTLSKHGGPRIVTKGFWTNVFMLCILISLLLLPGSLGAEVGCWNSSHSS